MNAEAYPESARVYGSLGDAYSKTGEKDLAIEYFQRPLKLDPESHSIKEDLAKLGIKN